MKPGSSAPSCSARHVWYRTPENVHTSKSDLRIDNATTLPRVDIIYAHANMSPDLITAAAKNGAKGIVIAGVGDGNMTAPALEAVKAVAKQGVVVVRSSRINGGIIRRNIEVNDDEARNGRVDGAQSGQGARAAPARADEDVGSEEDSGLLQPLLGSKGEAWS